MQGSIAASQYKNSLLAELAQAKELMMQLEDQFAKYSSSEFCRALTPKILSSIEKSIRMANSYNPNPERKQKQLVYPVTNPAEFQNSITNSPLSENSDQAFNGCKKRKTQLKWSRQVRLGAGVAGIEGPVDDGYSWRKYGQKDILGAKHPRGYYRCTHRNSQGCYATKQLQRSDDDPNVFDITYHGTHTCLNRKISTSPSAQIDNQHQQQQRNLEDKQDLLMSFQAGLGVKTEDRSYEASQNPVLFAFGSGPVSGVAPGNLFSAPSTPDNSVIRTCQPFVSPATSESTYFSASPCRMDGLELGYKLQTSESDLGELLSTNSSCNSTMLDADFMFDFDASFSFDQFDTSSLFL